MKRTFLLLALAASAFGEKTDHPTGSRITPPTINVVAPVGVSRGTSVEMTVEGLNLAGASAIYFNAPGVKGRVIRIKELPDLPDIRLGSNGTPSTVDVGPLPPRNQVTVELDVAADADIGVVKFRLLTPLGTSPEGQFLVEPYYGESLDKEPNDTPENAFETYLPSILAGAISKPGDVDHFKIQVKAGEELVFDNGAMLIGSPLQPVVSILSEDGAVLKQYGLDGPTSAMVFSHRFDKAGAYYVRIADYQQAGRGSNIYRYKAGKFTVAANAYPLGLRRGETREITVYGPGVAPTKIQVKGEPSPQEENAVVVRPKTVHGKAFNELKLALGEEPEVESTGKGVQAVTLPVTINGRIARAATDSYSFSAKKGQQIVFEVNARRLGSELDSEIEVVDAKGKPVERVTVRAISETSTVLRDHESASRGIRVQAWNTIAVGDYLLIGTEIVRVEALPRGPDDDLVTEAFGGQRISWFGTTSEAHAIDKPVYKVQIHPPGAQFTPNGLPLVRIHYRNDDGGPGYGKDSYLSFTAPADGSYTVRVRDVRGEGGLSYPYRLTIRAPKPDFRLTMSPRNPNVPAGGFVPVTITALRMDNFDGPIEVEMDNLPKGLRATRGVIGKGQINATILLSADDNVQLKEAVSLHVTGRAGSRVHQANPEDKLKLAALMPKSDVLMTAVTREVVLEPGGKAEIEVSVARQRDYAGRVPVQVLNLPPQVLVLDVGLNGVLVTEDESKRSFTIVALPNAEPIEQTIYVAGTVETRSPQQSLYAAPQPIRLVVRKRAQAALSNPVAADKASSAPRR
ncbi:MAG TPA: hypothetical protein VM120_27360 [Bryobacteraceae bacterium]|nr:hypothetical protein [Bryobacteraceae bacterium]